MTSSFNDLLGNAFGYALGSSFFLPVILMVLVITVHRKYNGTRTVRGTIVAILAVIINLFVLCVWYIIFILQRFHTAEASLDPFVFFALLLTFATAYVAMRILGVTYKELINAGTYPNASDLTEDEQYDLLFLHQRGVVTAKGSGQSITKINVEIENLVRMRLRVVVTPGTYFVSSGGHQNMVTTTKYEFTLPLGSKQQLDIKAACINANRPIPGKRDGFNGVARVPDNVARFLEAVESEDPLVIQAGVWTLTDNYSRDEIIKHLISRDNTGNTFHPVTHYHCNRAKAILDKLGIPHRLT